MSDLTFGYRAIEFKIPKAWYRLWWTSWTALEGSEEGDGPVSSVTDCLDGVWSEFRLAARARDGLESTRLDKLLGCYSLLPVADRAMFWRSGWGPHRRVFHNICRLVATYSDFIRDDQSDPVEYRMFSFAWCDGLGSFCDQLLRGQSAANREGEGCKLTIHFDALDERFQGRLGELPDPYVTWTGHNKCADAARACGYGVTTSADGVKYDRHYDDWESAAWADSYRAYFPRRDAAGNPTGEEWPNYNASFLAVGGGFSVYMHPVVLAWTGFVVDRILHLARLAWDYARYSGSTAHEVAARELGRYALGPMVRVGQTLIHEIGHTWVGHGGHCAYQCCFEAAAVAWGCAIRGKLGLPADHWESGPNMTIRSEREAQRESEFGGAQTSFEDSNDRCGDCQDEVCHGGSSCTATGYLAWRCWLQESGHVDGETLFCIDAGWWEKEVSGVVVSSASWQVDSACQGPRELPRSDEDGDSASRPRGDPLDPREGPIIPR